MVCSMDTILYIGGLIQFALSPFDLGEFPETERSALFGVACRIEYFLRRELKCRLFLSGGTLKIFALRFTSLAHW